MNSSASFSLKPFHAVRPTATGADLAARTFHAGTRPPTEHDQLVDQTRTWVAQTFFGTLLKQMRNSPFKSELFSGGQGGQAFSGLHDQQLAEHMARGAGSKLVNGIVRRIEANAAYRKQAVQDAGKPDNRRTNESREGAATEQQPSRRMSNGSPARRA